MKKEYSRKRVPPVELAQPIDYAALALAYEAARWRWGGAGYRGGFPTAGQLEKAVADLTVVLGPSEGELSLGLNEGSLSSGGLHVAWNGDKLVVGIDGKLAKHYVHTNEGV